MQHRSIMVVVTSAGPNRAVVQPPKGPPIVVEGEAGQLLASLADDVAQPEHRVEQVGFDFGAIIRGLARTFEAAGREREGE